MMHNYTEAVLRSVSWIKNNPGKHGLDMPANVKKNLRTLESFDLIVYCTDKGWKLTPMGAQL